MINVNYPLLGKGRGNLGNQLFQIASCAGIAKARGLKCIMPDWYYAKYFELNEHVEFSHSFHSDQNTTKDSGFEFDEKLAKNGLSIDGWLQTDKYWNGDREFIKNLFRFKKPFLDGLPYVPKGTISISVRRGDYVGNPNYKLLNIDYYIKALGNRSLKNVLVFSDDFDYCKHHFGSKVQYASGLSAIEQLALMTKCEKFIISNSTFAWWGAYLSNSNNIIRPSVHFDGQLAIDSDWKDYYPKEWFEVESDERDFSHVGFTIPVGYDHNDRIENTRLSISYIKRHFPKAKIYVTEQGSQKMFGWTKDYVTKYGWNAFMRDFHRTNMLNQMAAMAKEDGCTVLVNYDTDVLIPPMQLSEAISLAPEVGMVYPYDGRFARVPRSFYQQLMETLDTGTLAKREFHGMQKGSQLSVGGCVVWDINRYFECGGENERFISYGPEDVERAIRFEKLIGRKPHRVLGPLYHIDHFVGQNSGTQHKHFASNMEELELVKQMSAQELREYVAGWGI